MILLILDTNVHSECRCAELIETATRGTARFPRAVKKLFQRALSSATAATPASLAGRLGSKLADVVAPIQRHDVDERLAARLEQHWDDWLVFSPTRTWTRRTGGPNRRSGPRS